MTLHKEQERVQKAINNSLAHVQEDPWLTQRVLANVKGEEPVKRKVSLALILCIILALALMGTAYALFSSKAAEFFGEQFGEELASWLRGGKIAQLNETDILDSVEFTLDEVVYRDMNIYGVGTVRVKDPKDVLLSDAQAYGISENLSDQETLDLISKAQAEGGRILSTYCYLREIGVDEGTMMEAREVGIDDERNEDGSVTFSFESRGCMLEEGTTYQLKFSIGLLEWTADGEVKQDDDREPHYWTIGCEPIFMAEAQEEEIPEEEPAEETPAETEPAEEPAEEPAVNMIPLPAATDEPLPTEAPAEPGPLPETGNTADSPDEDIPAEAESTPELDNRVSAPGRTYPVTGNKGEMHPDGYEVLVPEEYKQTGTLPVYRAVKNDFTAVLQPEWLNQSGVADLRDKYAMEFNDHADLVYYPESIGYQEYTGEVVDYGGFEDGEPNLCRKEALSTAIFRLASSAYLGTREYNRGATLEHEQLTLLSLEDARRTADSFIEKLGMGQQGLKPTFVLDMSLDRIRAFGNANNLSYHSDGSIDDTMHDFSTATAEDEGYFFLYTPEGMPRLCNSSSFLRLFINSRGIVYLSFNAEFKRTEILDESPSLISLEEAIARFHEEIDKRPNAFSKSSVVESIDQVCLTYMPVRAKNKKDGMVDTPVWQISYSNGRRSKLYAIFNAVTGALITASFV